METEKIDNFVMYVVTEVVDGLEEGGKVKGGSKDSSVSGLSGCWWFLLTWAKLLSYFMSA